MYGIELLKSLQRSLELTEEAHRKMCDRLAEDFNYYDESFRNREALAMGRNCVEEKISILNNKGLYPYYVAVDSEGNYYPIQYRRGKYGVFMVVNDGESEVKASTEKALAKRGYTIEERMIPCWVKFDGTVFPSDVNYWTGERV